MIYPEIQVNYLINKVYYPRWTFSAGRSLVQFNHNHISLYLNDLYSLLFQGTSFQVV